MRRLIQIRMKFQQHNPVVLRLHARNGAEEQRGYAAEILTGSESGVSS
jgi:hypothetical protein